MDEYELFEFLEEDYQNTRNARLQRRQLRDQSNPFALEETHFIKRYRLTKDLVSKLCEELRPFMNEPTKSQDLSIETKVLVALAFYATGSYQRVIGDMAGHSVAQETVSTALKQITKCLNLPYFREKYIKFPRDSAQRRTNTIEFNNKFGMPGVVGCIDCTHIAIVRPTQNEERYYCRKQYHSLNVQLICNCRMDIISVDASYGGSSHDSFIWNNHPLKSHMEELSNNEAVWLLGDSGYALRKYMMTPIIDANPGSPEAYYTEMHVKARNTIERTIGLLKARFRCLLVHRVLHYEPLMAGTIVNACVILHNICNSANVPVHNLTPEETLQETQLQRSTNQTSSSIEAHTSTSQNSGLQEGTAVRRNLINQLWARRQAT